MTIRTIAYRGHGEVSGSFRIEVVRLAEPRELYLALRFVCVQLGTFATRNWGGDVYRSDTLFTYT